jgi:streptogramin lyase
VNPCGGLAAGPTAIWVTSCAGGPFVGQIDPATNTQVGQVDLGGNGYTFAVVDGRAWIWPERGQLVRLDPVAHAVDRVIVPGAGLSGGGDVVVAAGSFWVIDAPAGRLLRLPLEPFQG